MPEVDYEAEYQAALQRFWDAIRAADAAFLEAKRRAAEAYIADHSAIAERQRADEQARRVTE